MPRLFPTFVAAPGRSVVIDTDHEGTSPFPRGGVNLASARNALSVKSLDRVSHGKQNQMRLRRSRGTHDINSPPS